MEDFSEAYYPSKTAAYAAGSTAQREHPEDAYHVQAEFVAGRGWVPVLLCYRRVEVSNQAVEVRVPSEWQPRAAAPTAVTGQPSTPPAAVPGAPAAPSRPRRGVTLRVWEICDSVWSAQAGGTPDRRLIMARCAESGINRTTAGVQYAKWNKQRKSL